MPYVGRELVKGQNRELDDISSSFNSGNTAFTMQVGGVTTSAASVNQVFISLGGVMQHPGTDYTVSSSTLTFTTAPDSGLAFWGLIQGNQVDTGTPSDGTVGSSKFASGDLTFPSDITIPDKIVHTGDTNTSIRFPAADTITGETGGSERIRIDSSGRILKGLTTARGNYGNNTSGVEYEAQIEGTSATSSTLAIVRNSNNANDGGIVLGKTRSATTGGNTAVADGDDLGNITFAGSDGGTLLFGAEILATVSGTVGTDDLPADLVFKTNGGGTSTNERLRIDYRGAITVGKRSDVHASSLLAKFGIDCHGSNALADPGVASNYGLAFYNDPTTDHANGIGFFNDDGSTCGGYILHQDKGSGNLGDLIFGTSAVSDTPVEKLRIAANGDVKIADGNLIIGTAGHGIDFHNYGTGTGVSSNLLDDYEEGEFTPAFSHGATASGYSYQKGYYTKVGNKVFATFYVRANAGVSTNGNDLRISGLPFTSNSTAQREGGGFLTYTDGFFGTTAADYTNSIWIPNASAYLVFYKKTDGTTLKGSDCTVDLKYVIGQIIYTV